MYFGSLSSRITLFTLLCSKAWASSWAQIFSFWAGDRVFFINIELLAWEFKKKPFTLSGKSTNKMFIFNFLHNSKGELVPYFSIKLWTKFFICNRLPNTKINLQTYFSKSVLETAMAVANFIAWTIFSLSFWVIGLPLNIKPFWALKV